MKQQRSLYQKETENASRTRIGRPILVAAIILGLLAVLLGYLLLVRPGAPTMVPLRRGLIRGTVVATGEVVSAHQAQISSRVAGLASAVPVTVGQEVVSGTLLVAIGADALNYQVEDARLRVEIARLRLAQAQEGARPEEIAAAQAELNQADAQLRALETGPRGEEISVARQEVVQAQAALEQAQNATAVAVETARLSWETAANALRDAQDAYSRIYWDNERLRQQGVDLPQEAKDAEASAWRRVQDGEAAMEQARLAYERALEDQRATVTTAQARLTQARARLSELVTGPTEADLASAQAQVDRAQAYLALQRAGPRSSDVQILEKELKQAELALKQAQSDLDAATVRAPFDGTVVAVAVEEGEYVGAYSPLAQIADLQQLAVRAGIDEIDVGQVAPGQAVTITLDAFPGRPLAGHVKELAPAVTVERGSASYLATIVFSSPPTLPLRLGMAANITIVTAEKSDALLAPRQAIERVGAGYYVTVLRAGRRERVRVTLGIADPLNYEILSGLAAGEQIVVP